MLRTTTMPSSKGEVLWSLLAGLFFIMAFQCPAAAEEIYRYKRMWPMLQQPWYFRDPSAVAIDSAGHVYVADTENLRIQKYTIDGQLLAKWGSEGEGDGQFIMPQGIAVGPDGSVYVTDNIRMDVQKFTADGQFIVKWPETNDLHFPEGIAVDSFGNVYVASSGDSFIYKFSSNGKFIKKWGGEGNGDGKFNWPTGIAIDVTGNLYVADNSDKGIQKFTLAGEFIRAWNGQLVGPYGVAADAEGNIYVTDDLGYEIHKFSSDGKFIRKWGDRGKEDGKFMSPKGVAVDPSGNVYVADTSVDIDNNRLQKFTPDGQFIGKWGSNGSRKGQFWTPIAVAVDGERNVYVLDKENYRIQKFSALGQFITQWGKYGDKDGQFIWPAFIAVDTKGNVYVAGDESIQKFTPAGQFLKRFGKPGDANGEFNSIDGIAIDGNDQVYVTDEYKKRVQKFSSEGQFLTKWGAPPTAPHKIWWPNGIAVDAGGKVYVADNWNGGIQIFTADGLSLGFWGEFGDGKGELWRLSGVAVDAAGDVFVADSHCHRIQKFTGDGQFIAKIGQFGSNPGQLNGPRGVAVDTYGSVYAVDTNNNRIVVFEPVSQQPGTKAIVLAGGGPYSGNSLWDATQMVTNLAYRSLYYQGFTKDRIRYLTSNIAQDLDDNGAFDDLYPATKNNLRNAITGWAKDAQKLIIYLADHGGAGTFHINAEDGEDGVLQAVELSSWLDELSATQVVVILDACYSGSFIKPLAGSGRIVISSSGSKEKALFGFKGSLSFSNYFWAQVFNGASLHKAFATSKQAVRWFADQSANQQHPQVDADGNGKPNEAQDQTILAGLKLVSESQSFNKAPVIKDVAADPSPIPPGSNTTTLTAAGVTDADGIQRVWAVIWPPDFSSSGSNPITELPYVDLQPIEGKIKVYQASYGGFSKKGTYHVLIYAMDRQENISSPKLVKVDAVSPLTHKALLVAGGSRSDPWFGGVAYNVGLAYHTLVSQNYAPEDIRVLSPAAIADQVPVTGAATREKVRQAIQGWAAVDSQDLVLYLVGTGEPGAFYLGQGEKLYAAELSTWLSAMAPHLPGNVVVVYDGCHSGSFLETLKGPKHVVIASAKADQSACLANDGISSFSQFFWTQVLMGASVWDAFREAEKTIYLIGKKQVAQLDDDGDGKDTVRDGPMARLCQIGMGFSLGSDPPMIGSACRNRILDGRNSATIWVSDVATTGTIKKVWGLVVPPGYQPGSSPIPGAGFPSFELQRQASGRYQYVYPGFTAPGQYLVTVFATDTEGNVSQPKVIKVTRK